MKDTYAVFKVSFNLGLHLFTIYNSASALAIIKNLIDNDQ